MSENHPLSQFGRAIVRGDIGQLHRAISLPAVRSSRTFALVSKIADEKRGAYRMKITYCPPLALLWCSRRGDSSDASFLHKFYLREAWRERGLFARLKLLAGLITLSPIVTFVMMVWTMSLNGATTEARTGKSITRQAVELLHASVVHSVLPPWYYVFELFDDEKRQRAGEYLQRFETKGGIFRFIKDFLSGPDLSPLQNKLLFDQHCHEHAVSTAPVLMVVDRGRFSGCGNGDPRLPRSDLFVKPIDGRGGHGAERWCFDGASRYADTKGTRLTEAELIERIKQRSASGCCIVQPRMVNHPAIADLSTGALSTARIMTIQNEQGGFEATDAAFRMAVGNTTVVDNFHAGGIAARVDIRSGELGRATDLGLRPDRGWCDIHPDTKAQITGRALPMWQETLDLVCRAHAAFSDRILIGWDVAILADGPVIIEGNAGPDVDILERTSGAPLGEGRFGHLLAFHLRRAIDVRDTALFETGRADPIPHAP